MPLMIDAESLQTLLEERTRAYAHRAKLARAWLDQDRPARLEGLETFEAEYPVAEHACNAADRQIADKVELLDWQVENNI